MRPLKIAIISGLFTPLPPKYYGGIERVVCAVSEALHARGHEVTLFGPDEIQSSCRTIAYGRVMGEEVPEGIANKLRLWRLLHQHRHSFDVVHNFFRTAFLLSILPSRVAKIMSYACPLNPAIIRKLDLIAGKSLHYTVCGRHMLKQLGNAVDLKKWHVVYNPIMSSRYTFHPKADTESPYLIYLSRLSAMKGAHVAIEVAKRSNKRLVIAGNVQPSEDSYFETMIKPHIDGKQIQYLGPVDDAQKNAVLGGAEAMLFPISWEEPFGLVVGEAMACGVPVLAYNRGSMSEIIAPGKTGFLCNNVEEMCAAVGNIGTLDRLACRTSMETRFAPDIIAGDYERIYWEMLQQ